MKKLIVLLLTVLFLGATLPALAIDYTQVSVEKAKIVKLDKKPTVIEKLLAIKEEGKSQLVAALLAFFLGSLGIHLFYLGYKKKGMTRLILWLLSTGGYIFGAIMLYVIPILGSLIVLMASIGYLILWILALIDFIKILTGDLKPAEGDYADKI